MLTFNRRLREAPPWLFSATPLKSESVPNGCSNRIGSRLLFSPAVPNYVLSKYNICITFFAAPSKIERELSVLVVRY